MKSTLLDKVLIMISDNKESYIPQKKTSGNSINSQSGNQPIQQKKEGDSDEEMNPPIKDISEDAQNYDIVRDPEKIREIADLSDEDFIKEVIAIRFRGNMTGEDVWLVSNQSALDMVDDDGVIFHPDELRELVKLKDKGLGIEDIKKIVLAKKIFGGKLVDKNKIH
ncbi:MAG: hypothetical protein PHN89_05030 [Candidatus Pacebacteria bacterium]|nr:hypothetical protein [Candidatus Paceibacterota bacterium]MDD5222710.1 hypothetical protein [bacterium]